MPAGIGVLLLALAAVQDGGKLAWTGKDVEDARSAMADAKRQGRAMLLFFTSDG